MTTLTAAPAAPLLARLFDRAAAVTSPAMADLEHVRTPGSGNLSLPFIDDVALSMRLN